MTTQAQVARIIETVDTGLVAGLGKPTPGQMCVEAAICYALGLPHSDDPKCVAESIRALKIVLNDSPWSDEKARADGLRSLAVLQLDTKGLINETIFAEKVAMFAVTRLIPRALRLFGLEKEAIACEKATNLPAASDAAWAASAAASAAWAASGAKYAASAAARAARAASDAWAAKAASDAAWAASGAKYAASAAWAAIWSARAAEAAAINNELKFFADGIADILIKMKVPGTVWLPLLAKDQP